MCIIHWPWLPLFHLMSSNLGKSKARSDTEAKYNSFQILWHRWSFQASPSQLSSSGHICLRPCPHLSQGPSKAPNFFIFFFIQRNGTLFIPSTTPLLIATLRCCCFAFFPTWHNFRRHDERDPGDHDEEAAGQVGLQQHRGPPADQVYLKKEV